MGRCEGDQFCPLDASIQQGDRQILQFCPNLVGRQTQPPTSSSSGVSNVCSASSSPAGSTRHFLTRRPNTRGSLTTLRQLCPVSDIGRTSCDVGIVSTDLVVHEEPGLGSGRTPLRGSNPGDTVTVVGC